MRLIALLLIILTAPHVSFAAEAPVHAEKSNLTVLADDRLLLPLVPLVRQYATISHTPITAALKDTGSAESQIEQGLEAHVIITADQGLLDRLAEQGLTDVTSRRVIARTQLALVTAERLSDQAALAQRISFASMLAATPGQPVLASDPITLEGERVTRLLTNDEFSAALTPRLQWKTDHEEVIEDLRDSNALGLVLAADAALEPDLTVLTMLPDAISPPVTFYAVVLGSESMQEAKAFVAYLGSRRAQEIFAASGFQTPTN